MDETNSRLRNLEEDMACMRKKINGGSVTAEDELSDKLRENSDFKRLHSVTKGCGGASSGKLSLAFFPLRLLASASYKAASNCAS